jgi:hypothetical protein
MAIATHLGPWLLGTVKNTTGTTAGTVRNIGATPVVQYKVVSAADGSSAVTAFALPAGAMIQNIQFNCTTLFGAGTMVVSIGATAISGTFTLPTANFGVSAVTLATTTGAAALLANVGTTDALVTYTLTSATTGVGNLIIAYVVRNPDGTYAPSTSTGP